MTDVATDLVEYLVLVVPSPAALADVGTELACMAGSAAVRLLDLVVVSVGHDGRAVVTEPDDVPGLGDVVAEVAHRGVVLSRHDIELVALALHPGDTAVVVVVEDRWAAPLAAAARAIGGEVRAGERISRARVEAALERAGRRAGG